MSSYGEHGAMGLTQRLPHPNLQPWQLQAEELLCS